MEEGLYTLYSLLLVLGAVLTGPYWIYKAVREKKYVRGIGQRLGWGIPSWRLEQGPVWIHAVSVGEVLAAKPLLAALVKAHASLPVTPWPGKSCPRQPPTCFSPLTGDSA
jgi:3-deoxy-D-manno-octulosonic-acid transferase